MKHYKNTSRYSDADLLPLFQFAQEWIEADIENVAVNIKNLGRGAYRGRAYLAGPPAQSPWNKVKGVNGLLIVAIGHPERFPVENLHTYRRKRLITDWIEGTPMPDEPTVIQTKDGPLTLYPGYRVGFPETLHWELRRRTRNGTWEKTFRNVPGGIENQWRYRLYHEKVERLPYGGKGSRYMKCFDWREGFITVAAHELYHFKQRDLKKRFSEVECEQQAGVVLDAYRRAIGTEVTEGGKTLVKRGVFSASLLGVKVPQGLRTPATQNRGSQGSTERLMAARKKDKG